MYAIIKTGGKQYKVEEGKILSIEKIDGEPGSEIEFNEVLFINKNDNVIVGEPKIENAKVIGEIVDTFKDKKILVFKFKRRKNYKRKKGHRQWVTKVKIKQIVS